MRCQRTMTRRATHQEELAAAATEVRCAIPPATRERVGVSPLFPRLSMGLTGQRRAETNGDDRTMAELAMGIDLGTSYSCVALVVDGKPTVIPNEWGERTHASVVSFLEAERGAGRQHRQAEHHHQRREHRLQRQAAHRPLLLLRRGEEGPGGDALPDRRRGRTTRCASRCATRQLLAARDLAPWCCAR